MTSTRLKIVLTLAACAANATTGKLAHGCCGSDHCCGACPIATVVPGELPPPLDLTFAFSRKVCTLPKQDAGKTAKSVSTPAGANARLDDGSIENDLATAVQRVADDRTSSPAASRLSLAFAFSQHCVEDQCCHCSATESCTSTPRFDAESFIAEFAARERDIVDQCESPAEYVELQQSDDFSQALKFCTLATPFAACYDADEPSTTEGEATEAEHSWGIGFGSVRKTEKAIVIVAGRMKPTYVEQLIARGFPSGHTDFGQNMLHSFSSRFVRYWRPAAPLEHEFAAVDGIAMRFADEGGEHPIYR